MAERNSCPYLKALSKASSLQEGEKCNHCNSTGCISDCNSNSAQRMLGKLDQKETMEILDNVIIHFGKNSRVVTSSSSSSLLSNQVDGKDNCNCFSSWFKNNNKTFLWDSDLKKAFVADSNVPFQTAPSTSCKIDTSSSLFNSFKEFVSNSGSSPQTKQLGSDNSEGRGDKELLLNHHSKIIEDLKSCWKRRHQIRPFPDNISWLLTLLREWKIPFKNLFENQEIECSKEEANPKIFIGFKRHDVRAYFRNCIMTALHAITQFKLPSVTCILGDEHHVYIFKIDYKRSLKKTILSIFKYAMYNHWNHQCSLYLHLYKLFDSYLPTECSVSAFDVKSEEENESLNVTSTSNNSGDQESLSDKQLPTVNSSLVEDSSTTTLDSISSQHEISSPKIQAIKQRTEEILRTISSQHRSQSR